MPPRLTSHPTDAELEILNVLWDRGSATVREVFETLSEEREVGYTTVLKMMQIMQEKRQLKRNTSERSHRYTPMLKREPVQRDILRQVIRKVFSGSASGLVQCAIGHAKTSRSETAKIHALLKPAKKAGRR